jgi:hypothetical protein
LATTTKFMLSFCRRMDAFWSRRPMTGPREYGQYSQQPESLQR